MKKVVFSSLAAIAAFGVSACSEKAQEQTEQAADAVGNDVEAAVDTMGNAAEDVGNSVENGAAAVEAEVQGENKAEAKAD